MANQIKIVFFDMEGVIFDVSKYNIKEKHKEIAVSAWPLVFAKLNALDRHAELRDKFVKGEFGPKNCTDKWSDSACQVFKEKGLTKETFMDAINNMPLMAGAKETFEELHKRGYKTAIITGSFEELAERAKTLLVIDFIAAHCKMNFDKSGKLDSWKLISCDYEGKVEYFHKILKEAGLKPDNAAFIADEMNDMPLFKEAGFSIAFNSTKEEVKKAADVAIDKKDLREVLKHLK
ncbi:MAG: HAD family phosphatase [Nanoarchaeota archaeon]|nr:HAD family phosphatase [Nanoarchaeota archaeon]